jgi:hypothetical protein
VAVTDLSITIDLNEHVPAIVVAGDVNQGSWPDLAATLANIIRAGNERAVVHLVDVTFVDPDPLEGLAAEEHRDLRLRNEPSMTRRLLDIDARLHPSARLAG